MKINECSQFTLTHLLNQVLSFSKKVMKGSKSRFLLQLPRNLSVCKTKSYFRLSLAFAANHLNLKIKLMTLENTILSDSKGHCCLLLIHFALLFTTF